MQEPVSEQPNRRRGHLPVDWAPPLLTPWNEAWFTSGALVVQRCTECGTQQHPPEEVCHACGAMTFDGVEMASTGTVYSFTIAHYAANPVLSDSVPYTIVLVSLDDAPHVRVVGNLSGPDVHIGMPVVAEWEERTAADGTPILLPQWHPAP